MIPLKDQEYIRQKFAQELFGPVKVDFFTERELGLSVPGKQPCELCKPTREMLQELSSLSEMISLRVHYLEDRPEEARKFVVERVPAIVLRGASRSDGETPFYKFYGMPGGTEFPGFIETISDVSRSEVLLSEESVKALVKLNDEVSVRVFVTPTCPYCPGMARLAHQMTMVNPKVRSEVIEVQEFPDLGERYQVRAVPLTVINDSVAIAGMVPEQQLIEQVVKAAEAGTQGGIVVAEVTEGETTSPVTAAAKPRIERGKERPSGLFIP
jgi:glutaredoxin-like protein